MGLDFGKIAAAAASKAKEAADAAGAAAAGAGGALSKAANDAQHAASEAGGAIAKTAGDVHHAASAAATSAGDAIAKTANSVHQAAADNIPGYSERSEAVKQAAESAFESAQAAAGEAKQKIDELLDDGTEEYEAAIVAYNTAYTDMNDRSTMLHRQRERAMDVISFTEKLINSIANRPKSFDADFEQINVCRKQFTNAEEYAARELAEARATAGAGGAGLAAGVAIASLAPSAAMAVATTFGTASTGAAISTLSGAAATNAALAWLGGGAVAAGGGGVAGGTALLALAGPVGWGIAGASLLASVTLFTRKRIKLHEEKNEELLAIKANTEQIREMDAKIGALIDQTASLREALDGSFVSSMHLAGSDYTALTHDEKAMLDALVNNTMALASLLNAKIAQAAEEDASPAELQPEEQSE